MHTLTELRGMLERHGLSPRKSLGQNFLIDKNLAAKLLDAAGVGAGSLVLEIGPGAGALTEDLLARGCVVIASELDMGLCALLEERFAGEAGAGRFTLVRGDCLASKNAVSEAVEAALRGRMFTLVANLPYNAATPVIMTLLTRHHPVVGDEGAARCAGLFVTIQKEVVDRLGAAPGTKALGALTVMAQTMAEVERIAVAPPECFWPRPGVTSAMAALRPRAQPLVSDWRRLADLTRRLFSQRRKKIGSVLGREGPVGGWPPGVSPDDRAESLSPAQWAALSLRVRG